MSKKREQTWCDVLWGARLRVAVSLVLRGLAVRVAVVALDHRVVVQPFAHHFLLLRTCKRGRASQGGGRRAQLS